MKKISEKDIQIIQNDYKNGLSENQIAKKTHLSKGTISKYLHSDKFNSIKLRNKINSYKKIYIIAANKKLKARMRKIKTKAEKSTLNSNPSNNVTSTRNFNSPKLKSSVTNFQLTKANTSSQAKKLQIKNKAKSTPTSSNASKDTSFMPYLTKKEVQDEKDIEVITNPREIDPFTLLQFMNIYTDIPHQLFVYKHWSILSKRLVQHYSTRSLRKAKRIQNRFKFKMKAREKAENGAKYIFNRITNSFKKSNHNKR